MNISTIFSKKKRASWRMEIVVALIFIRVPHFPYIFAFFFNSPPKYGSFKWGYKKKRSLLDISEITFITVQKSFSLYFFAFFFFNSPLSSDLSGGVI